MLVDMMTLIIHALFAAADDATANLQCMDDDDDATANVQWIAADDDATVNAQ